ncbi:MAG: DUF2207 domain-containing protein [Planctomycetota bacterium]
MIGRWTQWLFGLLLLASAAAAEPDTIKSIDAKLRLHRNGVVSAEEVYRFPSDFSGRFERVFPTRYRDPGGALRNSRLVVDEVSGGVIEQTRRVEPGALHLVVKCGPGNGPVTVVLRYHYENLARNNGAEVGFKWELILRPTFLKVAHVSASVSLPAGVDESVVRRAGFLSSSAYQTGNEAEFSSWPPVCRASDVSLSGGLAVWIWVPERFVDVPGPPERLWWFVMDYGFHFVPVVVLLLWMVAAGTLSRLRWRGLLSPAPDWRPPFGLSPAEVGLLADDRLDPRDLTAAIVHLAVTGRLRIRTVSRDFRLELLDRHDVSEFERRMLRALARGQQDVSLRASRGRLAAFRSQLVRSAWLRLVQQGFRGRRFGLRVRLPEALVIATLVVLRYHIGGPASWWFVAVPCALGILAISSRTASWTPKGLEAVQGIRAMVAFIKSSKRESLDVLPPGAWDRVLPYAIALGLRDEWLAARVDSRTPPAWFETRHRFDASVRALDRSVRALVDKVRVYDRTATLSRILNLAPRLVVIRERYPTRERGGFR